MITLSDILGKPEDPKAQKTILSLGTALNNVNQLVADIVAQDRKKLEQKYAFPATIGRANMHKRALRYGYNPIPKNKDEKIKICPCCMQNCHTKKLNICKDHTTIFYNNEEHTKKFRVSSSVALFFTYIKFLIVMFLLRFLIVDCYNIITNLQEGSYCGLSCTPQFWTLASTMHKYDQYQLIMITDILSFAAIFAMLIYFLVCRRLQYKMYSIIDESNQTQDDYTIFVEKIPILDFPSKVEKNEEVKFQYEADLENLFKTQIENWIGNPEYGWDNPAQGSLELDYKNLLGEDYDLTFKDAVKSITLCYDISRIEKIHDLRRQIMSKYEKQIKKQGVDTQNREFDEQFDTPPERVAFLNESQIALCKSYALTDSVVFKATHFVGSAFVSFKYQHYRDHLVRLYQSNKKYFHMKGQVIKVHEASNPSEIKWKNLRISIEERRNRIFISYGILIVFLIFGFALLIGSDVLKNNLMKQLDEKAKQNGTLVSYGGMGITMITTLVTLVINYFLQILSHSLTDWEHHQTKSMEKRSLIIKLVLTQFFNNACIYYFISLIQHENRSGILSKEGLVFQISNLIVVSGAIQIFTNALNFPAILKWLNLKCYYKGMGKEDTVNKFQINLNQQFEYAEFDIAQRYSYYLLQLYTVSFYVYMVPITGPAIALIFICQYWVDKYNLFNRASLFYELNYGLSRMVLKLAETSIFIFSVGVLIFSIRVNNKATIFAIVGIVFSAIYCIIIWILPKELQKKVMGKYETCQQFTYDECVQDKKFQETYWYMNPATMLIDEGMATKRQIIANQPQFNRVIADSSDEIDFGEGDGEGEEVNYNEQPNE